MNSVVDCSELFSSILSFLPLHYWYSYKSICKKWFNVSQTTNTFKKKKQEVEDHRTGFRYIKSLDWKGSKDVICCLDEYNTLYLFEFEFLNSKCNMYTMDINANQLKYCLSFRKVLQIKQAVARNKCVLFIDSVNDLFIIDLREELKYPKIIPSMPKIVSIGVDETHFYFKNTFGTLSSTPKSSIFKRHAEGTHHIFSAERPVTYTFAIHDDYVIEGCSHTLSFYDKNTTIPKDPSIVYMSADIFQNIQVSNNLIFVSSGKFPITMYEITKGTQNVFRNDRLSKFTWTEFCVSKDYLLTWWYHEKGGEVCFNWFRIV